MLKPEQLDHGWLNTSEQLPYIIRLADFQANPANVSSVKLFEANLDQNPNNPFIHHTPLSPLSPIVWVNAPEQLPHIPDIEPQAQDSSLLTAAPHARREDFPGVVASNMQVVCWSKSDIPWNMPLYFRWLVPASAVGHQALFDFWIGQFVLRCGPATVEVFKNTAAQSSAAPNWESLARLNLFGGGNALPSTSVFSNITSPVAVEYERHLRGLLWLPYRRNYIYLEATTGAFGVVKSRPFPVSNGLSGAQKDWAIVPAGRLAVAGLTPGPGLFQIQRLKFATGPCLFNLEPFVIDYAPTVSPANNWLVDDRDTPQGSTCTHTTPTASVIYTFHYNMLDKCDPAMPIPVDDQTRTYQSVYTLTPGSDPDDGSRKTYTPMLYGVEARVPGASLNWPAAALSILDRTTARPSAAIRKAEYSASIGSPGRFSADVTDVGASLAAYYSRSDFPLAFSDTNGDVPHPANWTTLWLGVADPVETRETRLDATAPREMRVVGVDFWKWLNETPMRDNRDWTGFGHIYVIQSILKQVGLPVAGWDGPAPGTLIQKDVDGQVRDYFVGDAGGFDDPLGGPPGFDLETATGTNPATGSNPVKSVWRPLTQPPDSYGSFIKRIAEKWSAWDHGFHPDGTFYYHRWDYYSASEVLFRKDQTHAAPRYFRGSVRYEALYPDANSVALTAATPEGNVVTSSVFIDKASIANPAAVNFIGRERALYVALPGAISCPALNKAARSVFERARRRRLRVHFQGTYVPGLKLGHCHQLEGISGVWRLQSVRASYERPNWNVADYESEKVEQGFNLP